MTVTLTNFQVTCLVPELGSTGCQGLDLKCLCKPDTIKKLTDAATPCIEKGCKGDDLTKARGAADTVCKGMGGGGGSASMSGSAPGTMSTAAPTDSISSGMATPSMSGTESGSMSSGMATPSMTGTGAETSGAATETGSMTGSETPSGTQSGGATGTSGAAGSTSSAAAVPGSAVGAAAAVLAAALAL